jgi:hypothetical protein
LNVGAPFTEDGEEYGIHGTHSHTPATLETVDNPDPAADDLQMRLVGTMRTTRIFNPNVELRRTISSTLGESAIHIHDSFINRGNQPVPHAWLLHINFGYPLLEPKESVYCYQGKLSPIGEQAAQWFSENNDFRTAPNPLKAHCGRGEYVSYVDAKADNQGNVLAGVVNQKRNMAVMIEYPKKEFPRLVNWQHWGPNGSYTGALEPSVGGVEGRPVDRERGWYKELQPGESTEYHCTITATNRQKDMDRLLKLTK